MFVNDTVLFGSILYLSRPEKVGHFYILKNTFFLNEKRSIAASRANTTRDPRILAATNGKLMNPKRPPVMVRIYSVNHLSPTISKNRYINIEYMPRTR